MRKRKKSDPWHQFMPGNAGEKGFYIKHYGPFKTQKMAEFFNFIFFVNPRDFDAAQRSSLDVQYHENLSRALHPRMKASETSSFSTWWQDIFGIALTEDLLIKLAREAGSQGYQGFISWLESGAKINGQAPHTLIN